MEDIRDLLLLHKQVVRNPQVFKKMPTEILRAKWVMVQKCSQPIMQISLAAAGLNGPGVKGKLADLLEWIEAEIFERDNTEDVFRHTDKSAQTIFIQKGRQVDIIRVLDLLYRLGIFYEIENEKKIEKEVFWDIVCGVFNINRGSVTPEKNRIYKDISNDTPDGKEAEATFQILVDMKEKLNSIISERKKKEEKEGKK